MKIDTRMSEISYVRSADHLVKSSCFVIERVKEAISSFTTWLIKISAMIISCEKLCKDPNIERQVDLQLVILRRTIPNITKPIFLPEFSAPLNVYFSTSRRKKNTIRIIFKSDRVLKPTLGVGKSVVLPHGGYQATPC